MPTTITAALTSSARPSRRRVRRSITRWIKRLALAAIGGGIIAAIVYAWLPKPVVVDVTRARRTQLVLEVDEDGQTRVRDRFVVSSPLGGNLQRVEIEAGAAVAAGDTLARIEPPDPALLDDRSRSEATARLASAAAHQRRADTAISRATVARDAATREAVRSRELVQHGAITITERERTDLQEDLAVRDLAAAETERSSAAAEMVAARAVLGQGSSPSGHTVVEVRAPAAGRVLRVIRDSAGLVAPGAPLLEVGDPAAIEVVIDVLSSDAARIATGMDVAIEGWGGDKVLHGRVRLVEPSAFTRISALGVEEQRVKVIVTIDAPPPSLGDGFRVDARIFTWRGDGVLVVPASAVFRDHDRWAVYAIEAGRARLRPIAIGHRGRVDVEISTGLAEGTVVVLHPGDSVVDGVRVEPR